MPAPIESGEMQLGGKRCKRCMNCKCNKAGGKKAKKTGPKRKPSLYNKHISKEMKSGKSMAEAAKSWKAKK